MSFVKLENLNDFIQPSSTCIKPAEKKTVGTVAKVSDINLSDCLACSGCITSAETVLVQQQNHEELFKVINENKSSKARKDIVVSLSLQSISSLANKYSISAQECAERICSFFLSIGCDKVFDINLARHLALVESYREFKTRQTEKSKFPIISSVCPGWICYAEKTNGDLIIPYLSKVRSPQQIMGALIKRTFSVTENKKPSQVYHVTLMPCFDKKLEASRQDFKKIEHDESQDVDCVLTPVELEEIMNEEGVTLLDFDCRKLDILFETKCDLFDEPLTSHFGSVSGGYAENILMASANEGQELENNIEYQALRNSDFIELSSTTGSTGKFAIVNGFRNIQTVVQRLKRNALKYDYIEIMACPSGCINGGAQCKSNETHGEATTADSAKRVYKEVPQVKLSIKSDELNEKICSKLNIDQSKLIEEIIYTNYHPIPKMQNLTVTW